MKLKSTPIIEFELKAIAIIFKVTTNSAKLAFLSLQSKPFCINYYVQKQ